MCLPCRFGYIYDMRRVAATLAVVALLFSAGATLADDTSEANELFVEAVKLVKPAANVVGYEEKAAVLEEALAKLNKIVDDYPSSELAARLISGQRIGAISLEVVGEETRRARKEEEERLEFKKTLKAAEQGDAKAQFNLGFIYSNGKGVPKDYAEAVKWTRKAAEQGHAEAQRCLAAPLPKEKPQAAEPSFDTLLKSVAEEPKERPQAADPYF